MDREAWCGVENPSKQCSTSLYKKRYSLWFDVDEASSYDKSSMANGVKIKNFIQASGVIHGKGPDGGHYRTPNHATVVAGQNNACFRSTESPVTSRTVVMTTNITTKDKEELDRSKFIVKEPDETICRLIESEQTRLYTLHLLLRWASVAHANLSALKIENAPESIQHYTQKFAYAALNNKKIADYLKSLKKGFYTLPDRSESIVNNTKQDQFFQWLRSSNNMPIDNALTTQQLQGLHQVYELQKELQDKVSASKRPIYHGENTSFMQRMRQINLRSHLIELSHGGKAMFKLKKSFVLCLICNE